MITRIVSWLRSPVYPGLPQYGYWADVFGGIGIVVLLALSLVVMILTGAAK